MVILSKRVIREFGERYPDAAEALRVWFAVVEAADWNSLPELKMLYPKADYVGNDRYVFNIRGNRYRLIARIHFDIRTVYIRFLSTHAEYDTIDARTI